MTKTKKKSAPKRVVPAIQAKLTVVKADSYDPPRTRHIATTTKYPKPLCREYGYRWTASTGGKNRKLPQCKKCKKIVVSLYMALMDDPEERGLDDLLGILAELDEVGQTGGEA